jgi:hypothetical protein
MRPRSELLRADLADLATVGAVDLDLDLANSCWLVTTALLFVVLPIQLWLVDSF